MKAFYLIVALLFFAGCQYQNIEIKGTATGMDGSTVSILDANHKIIYGANIQSGKFEIAQQPLTQPGYYTLMITTNNKKAPIGKGPYEVYLEPGKYNITVEPGEESHYPHIRSSSAIQNDLTTYHLFTDSVLLTARKESYNWLGRLNDPKALLLPDKEYQDILANVKLWQGKFEAIVTTTLAAFVSKYPNNTAILHAMANMNIEKDPVTFFNIYQKLGAGVKNSAEGKQIKDKLETLNNLMPGSKAPALAGEMPDGRKFNLKDLNKKIIIVAFWRSGSGSMVDEQYGLAHNLLSTPDSSKVGIISVSFDTDRDTWLNSIKKSGLYHIQVNDLKGDDSPNAKNWNITTLPNYYILDGSGKVLYDNLSYQALTFSINEYLSKH